MFETHRMPHLSKVKNDPIGHHSLKMCSNFFSSVKFSSTKLLLRLTLAFMNCSTLWASSLTVHQEEELPSLALRMSLEKDKLVDQRVMDF